MTALGDAFAQGVFPACVALAADDEEGVQDAVLLVAAQRLERFDIEHMPAGGGDDGLGGGGIPFAGRGEARVEIGLAFGDQA